jgi:hypothetical protein
MSATLNRPLEQSERRYRVQNRDTLEVLEAEQIADAGNDEVRAGEVQAVPLSAPLVPLTILKLEFSLGECTGNDCWPRRCDARARGSPPSW